MAVHFDGVDGNHSVCLAGAFNAAGPVAAGTFTPAFAGLSAFTFAFTVQPDALDATSRHLVHCGNNLTGSQVFAVVHRGDIGAGFLQILFYDPGLTIRQIFCPIGTLVAGQINRVMIRARLSPELLKVQVNQVDVAVGLGGTPIATLNNTPQSNTAPLELGSMSGSDQVCVPGIYQQWAIWGTYLPDADAVNYGTNGNPGVLSQTGLYWVSLSQPTITPIQTPTGAQSGAYTVGHVHDGWSGVEYGLATDTYNYGSSNFQWPVTGVFGLDSQGGAAIVADLVTGVSYLINDKPSLPVEWFEMEELNGNCGQRSGTRLLVPSVYATWNDAANAAQFGDDIVIDHTYTGTTVADLHFPEKTFGPTTPRMPPTQKRTITMGRPITMVH